MNAPKLRFSEFDEKWKRVSLGEYLTHMGSGVTPRGGRDVYTSEGTMLIRSQNVNNNTLLLDDVVYIDDITHQKMKSSTVYPKDVLLNITGASIGRTAVVPDYFSKANVNQHVCILRPNELLSPYFLKTFLESSSGQKNIFKDQAGQTREALNMQQIKDFNLGIPTFPEQEKIAKFFSIFNKKIQLQQEKIDLLKKQKKGYMQKIFSQELRFKDENNIEFPEWKRVQLKDISKSISYGMNASAKPYDDTNIYLRITDIDDESRQFIEETKVSPDSLLEDKYLLSEGDILFARTGASVGKSFYFSNEKRPFYFAGFLIRVRLMDTVNSNFIYQNTLTSEYDKWIKIMSMRSGQPGVNGEEYGTFEINLPCLKEQDKIAGFLSLFDKKINAAKQYKVQLQTQKTAFLQQMFI